jgi:short-subunit dehydrogenase
VEFHVRGSDQQTHLLQPWSSFWHDKEDDRYVNIDININHCLKLTRIAMQNLVSEDRKGVVLPIASVGGLAGAYHVPLYIASKHAIVGFVKSMKQAEQYEGVKIVTICPGAVDTPLWSTERREKVAFHNIESLTADEVAKEMINLVQDGKYGGGTVLEIMPNNGPKTRVVPEWNIDKPQGGTTTAAYVLMP